MSKTCSIILCGLLCAILVAGTVACLWADGLGNPRPEDAPTQAPTQEQLQQNTLPTEPQPQQPQTDVVFGEGKTDLWADCPDGIRIDYIYGSTYNAYVMLVRNPADVYLATSAKRFSLEIEALRITQAIKKEGAIAAINAGAFNDDGTTGDYIGRLPIGLTIAEGEVRWDDGKSYYGFAGFDNNNVLVVADKMSAAEAKELGIRDGCCFGPVLIKNGVINNAEFSSNSGYNPRTCIGQRADGAVVFVCIDGRQASSIGGTYRDAIDILWEYGCVNACNLDGGSSSIMLYRDTYGLYGEAGQVQMINNYSLLQENPRRMPSFWMVRPAEEE
jgi:exopolysaccharide biosynthesis protein